MIKQLDVGLGLNTAPFEAGLMKAGSQFSAFASAQQAKLAKLNREMSALGGSVKGYQGFDAFGKAIDGANAKLSKMPFILKGVQSAAMGAATVLGGVFGVGIKHAMEFEDKMGKIRALTTSGAEDLKLYEKSLVDIAKQVGVGPGKLADALYFVTSNGLKGAEALEGVRYAAMGAKMGMGEAGDVAKVLTATIQAFPGSGLDMAKSFDLLTQAIKYGAAEPAEYARVLGNVLSVAKETGQGLEEVYAAVATMTKTGLTAGQGVTELRTMLLQIIAPSKVAADAFKGLADRGYDIKKTLKEKGVHAAMVELKRALGDNAEGYRVLFPSVEALNMAMTLGGAQAKSYAESIGGMKQAAGSGAAAFAEIEKTSKAMWDKMKADIEIAFEEIGKAAMPVFQSLLPTVKEFTVQILHLIGAFAKLPPWAQKASLGLIATAGPLSKLAGMVPNLIGTFAFFGKSLTPVVTQLGAIGFNAVRSAQGLPTLVAPTLATQAAFLGAGGAIKAFAVALGTATLAIGSFLIAYKLTKLALDTKWGKAATNFLGDSLTLVTGMKLRNDWMQRGQQVTKNWSDSERTAFDAHIARMKRLAAVSAEERAKDLADARRNVEALKQYGFGMTGFDATNKFKTSPLPGLGTSAMEETPRAPMARRAGWSMFSGSMGNEAERQAKADAESAGVAGMAGPIALSRDMVKQWRKEAKDAQKTADEWKKSIEDLSGVSAAREMDALRQQVEAIGGIGAVKNIEGLTDQVKKLAKEGAEVPKALIPVLAADQAKELQAATAKLVEDFKALGDTEIQLPSELEAMISTLDVLGPTASSVRQEFEGLMTAVSFATGGRGVGGLDNKALTDMMNKYVELAGTAKLTDEQIVQGNALIREYIDRNVEGLTWATEATFDWGSAFQGLSLLAGVATGDLANMLSVVENIGQAFQKVRDAERDFGKGSKEAKAAKFNAIAGVVGQIGGQVGGTAGAALQGAAGGAMTGFALGGPIGAAIGGVVGGIAGIFGAKKKKRQEEQARKDAEKQAFEDLTKSIEEQYGSIGRARNEALRYGINLKNAMDTKNPKALENALKDLEKRTKGMQTAMQGAAGLANYKAGSEAAAAAQGALFGTVFWAAVKTQGYTAAVAALGEPFDKMWEGASEKMRTVLAPIRQQIDLARNESFAAAAQGASDLAQLLSGIADAGIVSIADLQNASILAQDQYSQALAAAQEQGLSGADAQAAAIRAVGPAVAELIAQYDALGIPLDENLAKLKAQAEAAGLMFPQEPMERAAKAMEKVAGILEKVYGLSGGVANNFDRIGNARVPSGGGYGPPPDSGTGGRPEGPDVGAAAGLGPTVLGRDTLIQAHKGEGVVIVPRNEMTAQGFPEIERTPWTAPPDISSARGDTFNIELKINENPLQTQEGLQAQREFTIREIERALTRNLSTAIQSGKA